MSMHSRPNRRREERREAFVNQAAAADTSQLHCLIPTDLHRQLRVKAAMEDTNVTALVITAIADFLAARG